CLSNGNHQIVTSRNRHIARQFRPCALGHVGDVLEAPGGITKHTLGILELCLPVNNVVGARVGGFGVDPYLAVKPLSWLTFDPRWTAVPSSGVDREQPQ